MLEFIELEKFCGMEMEEEQEARFSLTSNVEIPILDQTLDQMNFMLSMGRKLKAEGKVKFSTPPPVKQIVHLQITPPDSDEPDENKSEVFSTPPLTVGMLKMNQGSRLGRINISRKLV